MPDQTTVRVSTEDYEVWHIASPFNANFNARLKEEIPQSARWWDAEQSVWCVTHNWKERAVYLAGLFYGVENVEEVEP